jgi:anhydro-N-acetylmuramic acid kinase
MPELFIGLMSGTSLDGVDAVLAGLGAGVPRVAGSYHQPFDPALRQELLALNEYFRRAPPKSTGRETFNLEWLEQHLSGTEKPADVQATLLALTASGIRIAIGEFCAGTAEVYVCGGGARNSALMKLLSEQLAGKKVVTIDTLGVNSEHVEALAFAWLACRALNRQPGNLPSVTGAHGARILGAVYRA